MAILVYDKTLVRTVEASQSDQSPGSVLGETVEAGQPLRQDADNKLYRCEGNNIDPTKAEFRGYATQNGVLDEKINVQRGGKIYLGVDAMEGMMYFVSATIGETESGDSVLVSGNTATLIGWGDADGNIVISSVTTGLVIYP